MNVKVKILTDFNAPDGKHYTADSDAVMDMGMAAELARAGYVEIVNRLAVKIANKPTGKGKKAVKAEQKAQPSD